MRKILILILFFTSLSHSQIENLPDTLMTVTEPYTKRITERNLGVISSSTTGRFSFGFKIVSAGEVKFKKDKFIFKLGDTLVRNKRYGKYILHELTSNRKYGVAKPKEISKFRPYIMSNEKIKFSQWDDKIGITTIRFISKGKKYQHKQQLEYLGETNNKLSFRYQEFSDKSDLPLKTDDFEFDLSKNDKLQYKNLVIRIIFADNNKIIYEVINNF